MINIAICDDNPQICFYVEKIISDHCKKIFKTANINTYFSGESLIDDIEKNDIYYDIIFLDIHLDKLNGIKIGEKIRTELKILSTQIVYVSAYSYHAMELFSCIPFGFLIKPFSENNVEEIIDRWIKIFKDKTNSFTYKNDREIFKIEVNKILYFESIGRKLRIVTNNTKDIFYGNLKDVFVELEKFNFICIHRAFLVNYNHIIKLRYNELTMSNSDNLPISQSKRKELKSLFFDNNIIK